ncbi:MAG: hypothetical protein KDM63_00100 [Verrucomicrobiae bacterium]|nr:hypothetical protein [Verrucomicrobiae bacterium]
MEESLSFAKRMGKLWALEDAEPDELERLESLPNEQAGWTQFFTDSSPDDSWVTYKFLSLIRPKAPVLATLPALTSSEIYNGIWIFRFLGGSSVVHYIE